MRFYIYIIILVLASMPAACDKSDTAATAPAGPVTVGFWAGEPQSRTVIGGDGRSILWRNDDRVALWAKNASGDYTLENKAFGISFLDVPATRACFATELAGAMPTGTYTYYATYPVPKSVNGTQASFTLPATQDGRLSGGADIMIAAPCKADQLDELKITDDDNSGYDLHDRSLSLTMKHLSHVFRFYIPDGYNTLGEPVERIRLTMPQNIAGTVTADISDPTRRPSPGADAVNSITLALTEPLDASAEGARQYAYASILPPAQAYGSDTRMDVVLYSASYAARAQEIDITGKEFKAGHITPVVLHPQEKTESYKIRFTIARNNLGEDVQKVMLTAPAALNDDVTVIAPAGCSWTADGNIITVSAAEGATLKTGEYIELDFDPFVDASTALYRSMSGNFTAEYESEHAWHLTQTVSVNTASGTKAGAELTVPYLFAEDFSGVETFSSHDQYATSSAGSQNAHSFLSGWTGGRIGAEGGKSIRLACRRETSADYPARTDSAPIANLKSETNIKITFDYGANNQYSSVSIWGYKDDGNVGQTCHIGYVTENTAYSSSATDGTFEDENSFYIKEYSGSYTNLPHSATYTIHNAPEWFRLTWRTDIEHKAGTHNTTAWLYLDNIKVQIAQ